MLAYLKILGVILCEKVGSEDSGMARAVSDSDLATRATPRHRPVQNVTQSEMRLAWWPRCRWIGGLVHGCPFGAPPHRTAATFDI